MKIEIKPTSSIDINIPKGVLRGPKGDPGPQGIQGEKGDKGDPGTTNYNELTDKPKIQYTKLEKQEDNTLKQVNVTTTLEETKDLSDLGIKQFIPLNLSSYTSRHKLDIYNELPDGLYVVSATGYVDLISTSDIFEEGTIVYKTSDNLILMSNSGNYFYYWDEEQYKGGNYVAFDEMESSIEEALLAYQKTTVITAVTNITTQSASLRPYVWRRVLYPTGITGLVIRYYQADTLDNSADFEARLTIKTSKTDFTYTAPTIDTKFFGTDCENGVFNPQKGMIYYINFLWNSVFMIANVTGGAW